MNSPVQRALTSFKMARYERKISKNRQGTIDETANISAVPEVPYNSDN